MLAGCGEPAGKIAVPQPKIEKDAVAFPPGSPQLGQIAVAPAVPRRQTVLRFNGRLVWDEDRTVRIFSPMSGRVQSILAHAGDPVRAGQPLAWVASPELGQAQADARRAEQDHALAKKSLARIEELHAAGVAPAKDLQAAQADFARTAAEQARTLERLKLYGASASGVDQRYALRTPVAGVVVERNLNPGQELRTDAQGDKALFVVSDPSRLWFILDVTEADLRAVRPGIAVEIASAVLGEDTVTGRVTQVADLVDPQSRTVKVRGALDNRGRRLKAEMFVSAELKVPATGGLVVPTPAVYLRGEQHFVFTDAGDGRFVRKPVRLGPAADGRQVVLEGLATEDKVVVDGALLLERILAAKE